MYGKSVSVWHYVALVTLFVLWVARAGQKPVSQDCASVYNKTQSKFPTESKTY
jgi:hypothetical protein